MNMPKARGTHDFWAWSPEKCGVYSVKSAYCLMFNLRRDTNRMQLPSSSGDNACKDVWKLKVPPKVRVFRWRVLHEFLPARQILWRRHIEPIAYCEVRGAQEESIMHVLAECTVAGDV